MHEDAPAYIVAPTLVGIPIPAQVHALARHGARQLIRAIARKRTPADRVDLLIALGLAVSSGTEAERAHHAELAALAPRLLEGDEEAIDLARDWADRHSPEIVVEPPAEVRRLATRCDCDELIDMLRAATTRERRIELVQAVAMRSGMDRADDSEPDAIEEIVARLEALAAGDPAAIDFAEAWVAANVRTHAPWESPR